MFDLTEEIDKSIFIAFMGFQEFFNLFSCVSSVTVSSGKMIYKENGTLWAVCMYIEESNFKNNFKNRNELILS